MDRRHAEAMQGNTGQLFPGMTTAKISKALKDIVFANIRPEILDKLDRKPDGYTDMRRIVASEVANRLGDEKSAAAIIGHAQGKGDIDISVMTGYYADVVDEAEVLARKDIYFAFEGAMAKALGGSSLQDLAGSLNLPLPDTAKDVVYPDFKKGDVSAGFAQQEIVLTPEQEQARAFEDTETRLFKGEEARSRRIDLQQENLERLSKIPEKKIVEGAEKEALLEQTKKTTAAKLKQEQRTEKKEQIRKSIIDIVFDTAEKEGIKKDKFEMTDNMARTIGVGPSGEAVMEDKGFGINIPNLAKVSPVVKAGTALLQGQEADKEEAAGFLSDVVRDTLVETAGAAATKAVGFGAKAATIAGGALAGFISPSTPLNVGEDEELRRIRNKPYNKGFLSVNN
jgi:hypothetical protein